MLCFCFLCTEQCTESQIVSILSTPTFTRHPSPVTIWLNGRFELECSADGVVAYDWYKDGKLYKTSRPYGSSCSTGRYHQTPARIIVKPLAVVLEKPNRSQQKLLWVR